MITTPSSEACSATLPVPEMAAMFLLVLLEALTVTLLIMLLCLCIITVVDLIEAAARR
jgi:hypothetical protein